MDCSEVRRHEMTDYFHVLGRVPDAARLSACGDLFVLSSPREGRPVVPMEAMAAGVPAVGTAIGGIPEIVRVGYNGLLVASGDAEAIAAAILSHVSDVELGDRLAAGALASGADYDIARSAAPIDDHYLRLAAHRNSSDV